MPTCTWTAQEATQELLAVLPLLNRIMAVELRRETDEDATMPQFRVLAHLLEAPLTVSALARKRRVSLQSAGELIQSMVERGWVTRSPDPTDRRQSLLNITETGRLYYEKAQQAMLSRLVPLMENLTQDEISAVQVALAALRRVLEGVDNE